MRRRPTWLGRPSRGAARPGTCVYDRAGRGGSEAAATAQDGAQIATDLHTLLHKANVPGPYVLAGHSFGGLYVRIFAAHYPDEVAGLVLLDSTASSQPAKSVVPAPGNTSSNTIGRVATLASLTVPVGIARLYGNLVGDAGLPAHNEDQLTYDTTQANTVRSVADEYMRGGAAAQEAASLRDLGDKPLYVLTAGSGNGRSWRAARPSRRACRPTACTASSTVPTTRGCFRRSSTPPRPAAPSSTSSPRSVTTSR